MSDLISIHIFIRLFLYFFEQSFHYIAHAGMYLVGQPWLAMDSQFSYLSLLRLEL